MANLLDSILQDIGAISNPFGAPSANEWKLSKGVYTSSTGKSLVLFYEVKGSPALGDADKPFGTLATSDLHGETHTIRTALEDLADSGGRRLAVYEYPYKDGQSIRDMGRMGETYVFNLKFFGDNYQQKLKDFFDVVVNDSGTGTLLHPTMSAIRSSLRVKFKTYEVIHRYSEWNAVTIKATFVEDNTGTIELLPDVANQSSDQVLRKALQTLVTTQANISDTISYATALLTLPSAIETAMKARLTSIVGQASRLLSKLAATFSTNAQLQSLAAQANKLNVSFSQLSSGKAIQVTGGNVNLPPVYQVGFSTTTQAAIEAQAANFVAANQITTQQAVFAANQVRAAITLAIAEANANFGNDGYQIVLDYRGLAVSMQQAVEGSISSTQSKVKVFTVPVTMSARKIASLNGLSPDRQNDISDLNPYLTSLNYIPAGTKVLVPAA